MPLRPQPAGRLIFVSCRRSCQEPCFFRDVKTLLDCRICEYCYLMSTLANIDSCVVPDMTGQKSHAPIIVGRILLHHGERGDVLAARREMADGISCCGVAGQREGLAAAAAEILLAARAAGARL